MKPAEINTGRLVGDESPPPKPSQFSLRSLLVLTTIVSIGLAIGVHFGGVMVVVVAAALILVGTFLSADWLIRPQNRRALAFVTASAWIVVGSGMLMAGLQTISSAASLGKADLGWTMGSVLIAAGVLCYYIASRRWRKLAGQAIAITRRKDC
jgi:hypothetical protein